MSKRVQFADYEVGDLIPELQVGPVRHMDLVRYSGASGDFNPIHTDPEFAKKVGLVDGTIAHGMYVMALLGRLTTNWVNPAQIKSFGVKFKDMSRPGDTLICVGTIKRKKEQDNEKLIILSITAKVGDTIKVTGEAVICCD